MNPKIYSIIDRGIKDFQNFKKKDLYELKKLLKNEQKQINQILNNPNNN